MTLEEMLKQSKDFEYDASRYNFDLTYPEFNFSRGQKNYTNIIKRLKSLNLPDPSTFKYTSLTLEELKQYLTTILNKIFDSSYSKQIEEYNSLLKLSSTPNPFDATLETSIGATYDLPTIEHIHISEQLSSIEVVATSHEYIHALLSDYSTYNFNRIMSNYHYKELLSILIEYISVYELSKLLKEENLPEKHNIIRLHTNQEHIIAEEKNKAMLPTIERQASPIIVQAYKKCLNHSAHNSFGYIASDIYATRLFELFQDDPKTLLNIFKSIINGEKSINDLLNYYGISLRDKATINTYYKRLDNVPKL